MKKVTISPPPMFYWFIFFCYLLSIISLTPLSFKYYPVVIWLTMFFVSAFLVWLSFVKNRKGHSRSPTKSSLYKTIIFLCCVHALTFFVGCFCYRYRFHGSIEYSVIFFLAALISLGVATYFYLDFIGEGGRYFNKISAFIIKSSWVVLSFGAYLFSRSIFMTATDMPYDQVVTKSSVLGYAFLLYSFIYINLSIFLILWLSLLSKVTKSRTGRGKIYSSYVIFVPCILFWIMASGAYGLNSSNVMKLIFNVTIPMDSRDTFFCHDTYMKVNAFPEAVYMKVGESDYRLAIPIRYEYKFIRLKCSDFPPYYSLNSVKVESDLKYSRVSRVFYNLITDLESLSSGR